MKEKKYWQCFNSFISQGIFTSSMYAAWTSQRLSNIKQTERSLHLCSLNYSNPQIKLHILHLSLPFYMFLSVSLSLSLYFCQDNSEGGNSINITSLWDFFYPCLFTPRPQKQNFKLFKLISYSSMGELKNLQLLRPELRGVLTPPERFRGGITP